jgi:hypothetical protein
MFLMVSGRGFLSCLQNVWTPSKVIARLGKEINDESSYLYWAYKVISKLKGVFGLAFGFGFCPLKAKAKPKG